MATESISYSAHDRRSLGLFQTLKTMIRNIYDARFLIAVLFKRDFFAVYRKSFLGITWLIVGPILSVFSWVFMNSTGILNPGETIIPYPAFILMSTTIWGLFVGVYSAATGTLNAGGGIILQVKYAHEVLLVKQVAQQLANFIINFGLILIALFFWGIVPGWQFLLFPLLILPALVLASGVGLLVSVVGVIIPEIQKVVDVLIGLLIWITPVIYTAQSKPAYLQKILEWNPLTYLITGVRDFILTGNMEHWQIYLGCSFGCFVIFIFCWRLFYISEPYVIEKMI